MNFIISLLFFCFLITLFFYGVTGIIFCFIYFFTFRPVKRPDYSLTAGEYCLDKMKEPIFRKEFYYNADKSILKGYFYPNENSQKLMVICHGFRSGADDFLPLIKQLKDIGFNVFSFDVTGTYDSKGKSLIGMCQWLIDLDNTLIYLKNTEEFKHFKLYLAGHSLGGYAVLSALSLHKDVCGCVALAPVNDAYNLMVETVKAKMGNVMGFCKIFFDVVQKVRFGKYVKYNAVSGINSVDIPVLIVQGDCDKVMSLGNISVFYSRGKITNSKARFIESKGEIGGHSSLWHSKNAVRYKEQIDNGYRFYKKALKNKSYENKKSFFRGVNDSLYSQPNEQLIQLIKNTFI